MVGGVHCVQSLVGCRETEQSRGEFHFRIGFFNANSPLEFEDARAWPREIKSPFRLKVALAPESGFRSWAVILMNFAGLAAADRAAVAGVPVALFLDVDGTLLDLADRPDDVVTPAGLVNALAKAERKLDGALALISGRRVEDLDRLFAPLRLRASGVHGAQVRFDPGAAPIRTPDIMELPAALWTAVLDVVRAFPGTFAENKRYSFAVHYRLAPEAEIPLREAIRRLVAAAPAPVEVMDAHFALELKAPGYDKGRAITAFLSDPPFLGRTPIFVGDDITDEPGFAVVSARGGFAYSVGTRRPGALGAFDQPRQVRDWLAAFSEGNLVV
jgi:trehalose 6-phosphate phosphatase